MTPSCFNLLSGAPHWDYLKRRTECGATSSSLTMLSSWTSTLRVVKGSPTSPRSAAGLRLWHSLQTRTVQRGAVVRLVGREPGMEQDQGFCPGLEGTLGRATDVRELRSYGQSPNEIAESHLRVALKNTISSVACASCSDARSGVRRSRLPPHHLTILQKGESSGYDL